MVGGSSGIGTNELNTPWGITLDSKSNIFYISDSYNNRIMQYRLGSLNGTLVAGGNGPGKGVTQLFLPRGIYFDSTSNSLIITNFACNNIVRWTLGSDHWKLVSGSINGDWVVHQHFSIIRQMPYSIVWGIYMWLIHIIIAYSFFLLIKQTALQLLALVQHLVSIQLHSASLLR